jgi:hypothetical protein
VTPSPAALTTPRTQGRGQRLGLAPPACCNLPVA